MPVAETTLDPPPKEFLSLLKMALEPSSPMFVQKLELFLGDKRVHRRLEQLEGSSIIYARDLLEKCVNAAAHLAEPECHKRALRLLRSLCRSWGESTTSYTYLRRVKLLDKHPYAGSRNTDIFRATSGGKVVAVKSLKVYQSDDFKRVRKRFARETVIWRQLHHPNILPLLGISIIPGLGKLPCLISPWMPNGTIRQFVAGKPPSIRFRLLVDVCSGLRYLHARDIVHGDLKGSNVLVDSRCRARLVDFGLASFDRPRWTDVTSDSTDPGGTYAYMAPELFSRAQSKVPLMRKKADIYALGMLIYEVLTERTPFYKVPSCSIPMRISGGERPPRPPSIPVHDEMWKKIEECWDGDPGRRPSLEKIAATCKAYELLDEWVTSPPSPMQSSSGSSGGWSPSPPRDVQFLRQTPPLPGYPSQRPPGCLVERLPMPYRPAEQPRRPWPEGNKSLEVIWIDD